MATSNTIKVNGRWFGIHEYGIRSGIPIFYFHGFLGSRLDGNMFDFDKIAVDYNLWIIGIDRPGIGWSDFQPGRTMLSWPLDVLAIAEQLNIKKFSLLGLSGGGPYALACAYAIPEKIRSVVCVSCVGPFGYSKSKEGNAMLVPSQNKFVRWLIAKGLQFTISDFPSILVKNIKSTMPEVDLKYLAQPEKTEELLIGMKECFRQGTKGFLYEAELYRNNWGFDLAEIKSKVYLWHGTSDLNVNIELAKQICSELPNCKETFITGEGHLSLIGNHVKNIFQELLSSQ